MAGDGYVGNRALAPAGMVPQPRSAATIDKGKTR